MASLSTNDSGKHANDGKIVSVHFFDFKFQLQSFGKSPSVHQLDEENFIEMTDKTVSTYVIFICLPYLIICIVQIRNIARTEA